MGYTAAKSSHQEKWMLFCKQAGLCGNYAILLLSVKTPTSAEVFTLLLHHESPGTILVSHEENASFMLN